MYANILIVKTGEFGVNVRTLNFALNFVFKKSLRGLFGCDKDDDIDVKINDVKIEKVNTQKYLGVVLDSTLNFFLSCGVLCRQG